MDIRYEPGKRAIVVKLMGELDHHAAAELRTAIDREFARVKALNIVFDFSALKFMDSSGIGVIIGRYKTVKSRNGNVYVTNVNETVSKLLDLAGLYKIIKRK